MRKMNICRFASVILVSILICGKIIAQSVEASVNHICTAGSLGSILLEFDSNFDQDYPLPYIGEWENIETGEYSEFTISNLTHIISNLTAGTYEINIDLNPYCNIVLEERVSDYFPIIMTATGSSSCDGYGSIEVQVNSTNLRGFVVTCRNVDTGTTKSFGQSAPHFSIDGLEPGTYEITVNLGINCSQTINVQVPIYHPIAIQETITPVDCANDIPGTIQLSIAGGVEPYTITWREYGNEFNHNQTYLEYEFGNSLFFVRVVDAKGCQQTTSFILPQIGLGSNDIVNSIPIQIVKPCPGEANGSITFSVPDLTDYQIDDFYKLHLFSDNGFWNKQFYSPDPEEITVENLAAGDYYFRFRDENTWCYHLKHFTIEEDQRLEIGYPNIVNSCNGNGSISPTVHGTLSSELLNYQWSNGSTDTSISGLNPGTYTLTVTSNLTSCELVESFEVSDELPEMNVTVTPACTDPYKGMIIFLDPLSSGDNFSYSWDGNYDTFSPGWIYNLEAGEYCVTITGNASGCVQSQCYTIEENPDVIIPNADISATCAGQSTGSIHFTYPNSPQDNFVRSNLSVGEHCFDFSNLCNTTNVCFEVPEVVISIDLNYIGECDSEKMIEANVSGGTEPYFYSWNTGATSINLSEFDNEYTGGYIITVTDANGCIGTASIENHSKHMDYSYQITEHPCVGSPSGELHFTWGANNNSSNSNAPDDVQIIFNSTPVGTMNQNNPSIIISGLSGGIENEFTIVAGNCTYTETIVLPNNALRNEFSHTETQSDVVCVFDQFCGDELIPGVGLVTPVHYNFVEASYSFLGGCRLPYFCGDQQVGVKQVQMKTTSVVEYNLLRGLMAPYLPGVLPGRHPGGPCTKVRFCPATMKVVWTSNGGAYQPQHSWNDGICQKIACVWPTSDEYFCLEFPFDLEPDLPECTPQMLNVLQLFVWKDQMAAYYGEDFTNSTLFEFIDGLTLANKPEMTCSQVFFCKNDFNFLSSDFSITQCDNEQYVLEGFYSVQYAGGNETICHEIIEENMSCEECDNNVFYYCEDEYGTNNQFLIDLVFDPDLFELGITGHSVNETSKVVTTNHIDECYRLINMGHVIDSGCATPKGIFECNGKYEYEDFTKYSMKSKTKSTNNITFVLDNWDLDRMMVCSRKNAKSHFISIQNDSMIYTQELSSDNKVDIEYINNSSFSKSYVIGSFSGNLSYKDIIVLSSQEESTFVLEVDPMGNLLNQIALQNLKHVNSNSTNQTIESNLLFLTTQKNIKIGNHNLSLDKGTIVDLFSIIQSNSNLPDKSITISDGLSLIFGDKNSNEFTYVIKGQGIVKYGSELFNLNTNYTIVRHFNNQINLEPLEISGAQNEKIVLADNGDLFLMLSSSGILDVNNISLSSDNNYNQNILLRINQSGKSDNISYKVVSSNSDVFISHLSESCGDIFFGGSYIQGTNGTLIGNKIFYSPNNKDINKTKSFTSFSDTTGFVKLTDKSKMPNTRYSNGQEAKFTISPNPFINSLSIISGDEDLKIDKCAIRDIHGRTVYEDVNINSKSKLIEKLNLKSGLYILIVKDENGLEHVYKVVHK